MAIVGQPSASPVGGFFSLDSPSSITTTELLSGGWIAELAEGSQQLTVHGPTNIDNYLDALDEGLAAAQGALDLVAIRGDPALVLEGADAHHTVWWTEARGLILRIVSISDLGMSISAKATVYDSSGRVVPPPPEPAITWHPSFRYFRLSQTTSDLFDSYRNMYLALEAVLSDFKPQHIKNEKVVEREGDWLHRALEEVNNTAVPLVSYAPAGSTNPVDDIFRDLYADVRTGLFHAKSGRHVLLPHADHNRQRVIESLERLSRLYLDLVTHYLHARRPSGAITYVGFDLMTRFMAQVVISDDDSPAHRNDTVVNPSGGAKVELPTRAAPELSLPGLKFWLGEEQVQDVLPSLSSIRRTALSNSGGTMTVDRLDESLKLNGVDVLQVQLGLRLVNLQLPRFRFNT